VGAISELLDEYGDNLFKNRRMENRADQNSLSQLKLTVSFQSVVMLILISGYIVNSLSQHLKIADHTSFGQLKLTRFSKCCYSYFDFRAHSQQFGSS